MKLLNEFVASKYVQKGAISIACTRPPVVFGHGRAWLGALVGASDVASGSGQAGDSALPSQHQGLLDLQR